MADTYTALLRLIKQEDQGNINQWGRIFNSAVIDLLEESIAGKVQVDLTFGDVSLTALNGLSDQSRPMFIEFTGNPGTTRTVTLPLLTKMYGVANNTNPAQTIKFVTAGSSNEINLTQAESPTILCVDSVNDELFTLSRSDALTPAGAWVQTDVYEENVAGALALCRYIIEGDFVTIDIGGYIRTWAAVITHRLRIGGPTSALPAAIVPAGPDPTWAHSILETSVENQGHIQLSPAANAIIFLSDGGLTASTSRQALSVSLTYSLRTN